MILSDLIQVIYAPKKAFKSMVSNPKYFGVILALVLFMAFQVGYQYNQFAKTNVELTEPQVGLFQTLTNSSSGNWQSNPETVLTNNNDHLNYTVYLAGYGFVPSLYGNTSLQLQGVNTQNLSVSIDDAFNVDCATNGFNNLTLILKQVQPQNLKPQSVTVTLYSLSESNNYQYDLTPHLSSSIIDQWTNITIPVGPHVEDDWTENGNPIWNNITSLKLDFVYPEAQNTTIRISAIYFGGQYVSLAEYGGTAILFTFLQAFSLQFLVSWLALTGVIYLILKGLKTPVTWKPIFAAIGVSMIVMAIRAAISLVLTLTLPTLYYPYELWTGIGLTPYGALTYPAQAVGTLSLETQAAYSAIVASADAFNFVSQILFVISYVWLGALIAMMLGEVKPEFSLLKRISISGVAVGVTILVLIFLVTGTA